MNITTQKLKIPNWQYGDGTFPVRVKTDGNWFVSSSEQVSGHQGNYFLGYAIALNGTCWVQELTLPVSVRDNQFFGRYESVCIYKKNSPIHTILEDFVISDTISAYPEWYEIESANRLVYSVFPDGGALTLAQAMSLFALKSDIVNYGEALIDDDGEILLDS